MASTFMEKSMDMENYKTIKLEFLNRVSGITECFSKK